MCLTCEEWNTPTTAKVVQDFVACRRGWRPASPVPRNCAAPQQHGHMGDGEKEVFTVCFIFQLCLPYVLYNRVSPSRTFTTRQLGEQLG